MGLIFFHLFSRSPASHPGPISIERYESRMENGTLHLVASAMCGELQLTAVAAGVEQQELLLAVESLTVDAGGG